MNTPGTRKSARTTKRPSTATNNKNKVTKRPRTARTVVTTTNKVNNKPKTSPNKVNNKPKTSPNKVFKMNLSSSAWLVYRDADVAAVVNRFMYLGPGQVPKFKDETVEYVIHMISSVIQSTLQPNLELSKKVDSLLNSKATQIQKIKALVGVYIQILRQAWKVPAYISKGGTYYRGVTMTEGDFHSVMNGTVKSFTSTSSDPNVAHKFAASPQFQAQNFINASMKVNGYIIKYVVSPDVPMLNLNVNPHMSGVWNSWMKEFILPPGSKLREGTEKVEMYVPSANLETNHRTPVPVYTVYVTK